MAHPHTRRAGRIAGPDIPNLLAALVLWAGTAAAGSLTVRISPPEAVAAGAGWRLDGETAWQPSGTPRADIAPGRRFLEFKPVAGWLEPTVAWPVEIGESTTLIVSQNYAVLPRHAIRVTASEGGFVSEESWPPMLFDALRPPGEGSGREDRNRGWEGALRGGGRTRSQPEDNTGWRIRLRAMAAPGFQFVGWSGDLEGTANPATLIADGGPRRIHARFARPPLEVAATQLAGPIADGSTGVIHAQFGFPAGRRLESLTWRPQLPQGWILSDVDGLGSPSIVGDSIVFNALEGHNPVQFNIRMVIPPDTMPAGALGGSATYRLAGESRATTRPVATLAPRIDSGKAARLVIGRIDGRPVLHLEGRPGRIYTVERAPELPSTENPGLRWVFVGDFVAAESPRLIEDPFALPGEASVHYRATLLE